MTNDELNRITEQAKAIQDAAFEVMLSHTGLVVLSLSGPVRNPTPLTVAETFERMGQIAELAKQIHARLCEEPRRPTGRKSEEATADGQSS